MGTQSSDISCECDNMRETFSKGGAIVGGAIGTVAAAHLLPATVLTGPLTPLTAAVVTAVGTIGGGLIGYRIGGEICDIVYGSDTDR